MIINDLLLERQVYVVFFLGGGGEVSVWVGGREDIVEEVRLGGVKVISLVQKLFQAIYYFLLIRGGGLKYKNFLSQHITFFFK